MHFLRSRAADHAYDLAAGGAAHNGIVNQHDSLAFEQRTHWIQLQPDAEVADGLPRLDESAADIVIADQAESQRNSALGR